jgi:hypothetical protein
MSEFQHELRDEFPEYVNRMEELKASDAAFAHLWDQYHALNRAVIAAETQEAPTDHFHEEDMKKQRAALKDEIYQRLNA